MLENMVASMICQEFEHNVGRKQSHNEKQIAMKLTFRLSNDYDLEEGYRHLQVLIYAPYNYVAVFVKEDWTIIPVDELDDENDCLKKGCNYREGDTGWKMISYHDSCWRTDGIDRIIQSHRDRLNGLDTIGETCVVNGKSFTGHWYSTVEVTGDLKKEMEKMMSREGDYRYEFMKGVLQFEMGASGKIIEKAAPCQN